MSGWITYKHDNPAPAGSQQQQWWSSSSNSWRDAPRSRGGARGAWASRSAPDGRGGFGQSSQGRSQDRGRSTARSGQSQRGPSRAHTSRAAPREYNQEQWRVYDAERAAWWNSYKASPDGKHAKANDLVVHRKAVWSRANARRDDLLLEVSGSRRQWRWPTPTWTYALRRFVLRKPTWRPPPLTANS